MANEIDDLYSQLDQTTRQLKSWGDTLTRNSKTDNIYQNSLKESADITKEAAEAEKDLSKSISGTISGLTGFTKSLASGAGSFAPLTAVVSLTTKVLGKLVGGIPIVGTALKGLAEGAGEVANHMIESFDKAYGTFQKISDSGVITTFEDMQISARAMQLNFAQTDSVLTKHSKNLALFSGSALKGRQEFEKIAVSSYDVRRNFQKLGVSGEEFSEMQLSYLNQQMRTGQGQKKTTEEMLAGSVEYIKQLDEISKITGASKKDLQAEREARMNDAQLRAGLVNLPDTIQSEVQGFFDMLVATERKDLIPGFKALFAGGTSRGVAQELITAFPNQATQIMSMVNSVKSGQMTYIEAEKQLNISSGKVVEAFTEQASLYGADLATTKFQIAQRNGAIRIGKDTQKDLEDYRKKREQILADQDSVNSQLAETKQSLEQAQRDIEQMSTSSSLITGLMKNLAGGIEDVTDKFYELSGEDMPAHLKARKVERKALAEEQAARLALKEAESGGKTKTGYQGAKAGLIDSILTAGGTGDTAAVYGAKKQLELKIKEAEEATEKRKAAEEQAGIGGAAAAQGTAQTGVVGMSNSPNDYEGLAIGGKYPGEAIAGGPASKNLIALARKFQSFKPGGKFSAFNDATHTGGKHKQGLAFDYTLPNVPKNGKIPKSMGEEITKFLKSAGASHVIDEYNYPSEGSTGGHIHAEVSARTGGIFSGPDSGYLAELHGDESVTSVGDDASVSKTALGSGSMMAGSSTKISEIYRNLAEKMDTLIDLMDMSMENQKDFLEARLN